MKCIYFCSYLIEGDHAGDPGHALRSRTKRDLEEAMDTVYGRIGYGKITRCEVDYTDGFHLLNLCLDRLGPMWESVARETDEPA
jgi:hypothetical protein